MLRFFKKGKNTTEIRKTCAVSGEGAVTNRTCQRWLAKLCAGEFSLDDVPRSGRPGEVDSDQIKTLTENNQRSITWELDDILKISKSTQLLVKMKKCVFYVTEKTERTSWPAQ